MLREGRGRPPEVELIRFARAVGCTAPEEIIVFDELPSTAIGRGRVGLSITR